MRHIVLDTETTGLSPEAGHRVVEIGCVEIENLIPTGRTFHCYINPERDMPLEAFRVHGLSEAFLKEHRPFRHIANDFLTFIEDLPLIIHNAKFDMKFLNHELKGSGHNSILFDRAIDTVLLAKQKFPGSLVNLDALCKRFSIDTTKRIKHGALLDAELLADVYLHLMGGRQQGLSFALEENKQTYVSKTFPRRQAHKPTLDEEKAHHTFMQKFKAALWDKKN